MPLDWKSGVCRFGRPQYYTQHVPWLLGIKIGYPSSGTQVDGTSGLVKIKQGESIKVSLRLSDAAVEGSVQIKAINPATEKVIDSLALEFETHVF